MQVLETCPKALLCVNLLDEAEKRHITIDLPRQEQCQGIPVDGVAARSHKGQAQLQERLHALLHEDAPSPCPVPIPEQLEEPLQLVQAALPKNGNEQPPQ